MLLVGFGHDVCLKPLLLVGSGSRYLAKKYVLFRCGKGFLISFFPGA